MEQRFECELLTGWVVQASYIGCSQAHTTLNQFFGSMPGVFVFRSFMLFCRGWQVSAAHREATASIQWDMQTLSLSLSLSRSLSLPRPLSLSLSLSLCLDLQHGSKLTLSTMISLLMILFVNSSIG